MKEFLKDVCRRDRRGFFAILLLNILVALTSSVGLVMLVPMLDLLDIRMTGGGTLGALLRPFAALPYNARAGAIIALFVLLMLTRAVVSRWTAVRQNRFMEEYEMSLRSELYDAITGAPWEALARKKQSDLVNLFLGQCRQARVCLQRVVSLFSSAAGAVLQLAIACWLSLPLTLLVLAAGVFFLVVLRPFQRRSRACGEEGVEVSRALYREVHDQLSGIKETRAYGVEESSAERFRKVSEDYYDVSLRTTHLQVLPQLCYSVASAVLIALAFVVSVLIMDVDTARLVILVYIFSRLWPVFSSWQGLMQNIQTGLPDFQKVREAIDTMPADGETHRAAEPLAFEKEIVFDKVSFSYADSEETVLEDVSFTLPFGSVTALVGRSGAGKSTTADLLLGLLRPQRGEITADGVPLTAENAANWRRSMGYVPQSPLILDATIRENLLRFHPEATEEEMIKALKASLAWPFVEKLPDGLDTVVGARGVRLSGGEGQRIVLARVLMGSPRLIVLDEATSALDYESENQVRQTIQTLRGKTTVLVIAHRLATIRGADRAVVLEEGRVAEEGALSDLLKSETGYLARMVSVE